MLYDYLVSPKFRQRISDIVEAFSEMHSEIEKERRAMPRSWARREKLIERVTQGTATMYGDLEGIMGSEIPALSALEMPYALGNGDENEGEADRRPAESLTHLRVPLACHSGSCFAFFRLSRTAIRTGADFGGKVIRYKPDRVSVDFGTT